MVRGYTDGRTVTELARDVARSPSTIYKWLEEAGVPRRPRGPVPLGHVADATVIALRDTYGLRWDRIGAALDMSRTGARRRYRVAKARLDRHEEKAS